MRCNNDKASKIPVEFPGSVETMEPNTIVPYPLAKENSKLSA